MGVLKSVRKMVDRQDQIKSPQQTTQHTLFMPPLSLKLSPNKKTMVMLSFSRRRYLYTVSASHLAPANSPPPTHIYRPSLKNVARSSHPFIDHQNDHFTTLTHRTQPSFLGVGIHSMPCYNLRFIQGMQDLFIALCFRFKIVQQWHSA